MAKPEDIINSEIQFYLSKVNRETIESDGFTGALSRHHLQQIVAQARRNGLGNPTLFKQVESIITQHEDKDMAFFAQNPLYNSPKS